MGIIPATGDASKDRISHPCAYNHVFVFHGTGMHGKRALNVILIYIYAMEPQSDMFEFL